MKSFLLLTLYKTKTQFMF